MVLNLNIKDSLKVMKVSRVVFVAGLLTFLYCVEFCIGIRTVYFSFKSWHDSSYDKHKTQVSWTLCVGCLFTAVISSFSINLLSAMWEQKQLVEREKEKSAIRFAFHIMVGGMLWRYITLWFIKAKNFQKKAALLLTITKFLFTQTFTIPLVIVHVSIVDHLEEIIFDVCSIACISINLILTCTMFYWCSNEVEELKKWDFETVDLVPLIFQSPVEIPVASEVPTVTTSKEIQSKTEQNKRFSLKELEITVVKFIVLLQTFGFSLGRLLALGILLKLAGIYAVSIMFLQLLISVIYLKFQTPILVSDSLPKWRQLSRLAFMSYILIFEWHLNRNPKTGFDFSSKVKHSMLYYCVATIESVFYLITWAVTTSYSTKSEFIDIYNQKNRFCRIVLIIGAVALILSLAIHVILLLWRSRKFSLFYYTMRRRYETAKLRLSLYGRNKPIENNVTRPARAHVDISSPIPIKKNENNCEEDNNTSLEKHNSYRDLREPLDEEIEICFRKCGSQVNSEGGMTNVKDIATESTKVSCDKAFSGSLNIEPNKEVNILQQRNVNNNKAEHNITNSPKEKLRSEVTECKTETKPKEEECIESSVKSKINAISSNINEQWGKLTSVSQKFTGAMRDQIQKRKEQFQNLRNSSLDSKSDVEFKPDDKEKEKNSNSISDSNAHTSVEVADNTEGYFLGDSRCFQDVNMHSTTAPNESDVESDKSPHSDENHKEGDSPCPCYVCRILGDGRFRRRKSSSVPPIDRKLIEEVAEGNTAKHMPRYLSSPNISQGRCEKGKSKDKISPTPSPKAIYNLNTLSIGQRIEHYV